MTDLARPDWPALALYLSGHLPPDESARIARWVAADPARAAQLAAFERSLAVIDAAPAPVTDGAVIEAAVLARIGSGAAARVSGRRRMARPTASSSARRWLMGSVGVAALAVAGVLVPRIMVRTGVHGATSVREYATAVAQQLTVDLPDGSRVRLAPMSRVQYRTESNGARVAELQGHAYFTVAPDPARPFVVYAGRARIDVLGTTFDVQAYTDETALVALTSGKVAVRAGRTALVLTPGAVARVSDSTARIDAAQDARALADWTNGQLRFERAPVPTVLKALSRWYGYEFRIADSALAAMAITAALPADRPSDGIRLLEFILNATITPDSTGTIMRVHQTPGATGVPGTRGRTVPRTRQARDSFSTPISEVGK